MGIGAEFHDRLSAYGSWSRHSRWGEVGAPTGVEVVGWRPFTNGHWEFTEHNDWFWDSDFDWGWAAFHYGRWKFDATDGWLWVPSDEWAPVWANWRYGDQFVGWAPLGPEFSFGVEEMLAPRNRVFVNQTQFLAPLRRVDGRVVNAGMSGARVEQATGRKVERMKVQTVAGPVAARVGRPADQILLYRPSGQPRPGQARLPGRNCRSNKPPNSKY